MREAAAGNKPLLDIMGMASACAAIGWRAHEAVEPKCMENDAAWPARVWLCEQLETTGLAIGGEYGEGMADNAVAISTRSYRRGPHSGPGYWSIFTLVGTQAALEAIADKLAPLAGISAEGELRVTTKSIEPYTQRVRSGGPRSLLIPRPTDKFSMVVRVALNLRTWEIANLRLKGAKKKPLLMAQPYKGIEALAPKGVKAGQFWNSLYTRGLQAAAQAYLAEHGDNLPTEDEIDTPEEAIKRGFSQRIEKALEDFTARQLTAVEEAYTAHYIEGVELFVSTQAEYLEIFEDRWQEAGADEYSRSFPPHGRTNTQKRRGTDPTEDQAMGDRLQARRNQARSYLECVKDGAYGVTTYQAKEGWREMCTQAGKAIAQQIRAAFICKNTGKLSDIVTGKGDLKAIELLSWSLTNFEGELHITFEDGSHITVRNKTVGKCSSTGTWFNQYPTTFHFVTFADGTRMKGTCSERRVRKEFAAI